MFRFFYSIPFVVWLVVTIFAVQLDYINESWPMLVYCLYSVVIALSLFVYRNKINPVDMSKTRMWLYFAVNIVIGVPFFYIVFLSHAPLKLIYLEIDFSLMPWQQYVFISYVATWFIANALIIRPGRFKQVLLFLASPLLVAVVPCLAYFFS